MSQYITEIFEQPADPLGGASGEKRRFTVQYLAKANNPQFPFTVANELVATQLGQALGITVPTALSYLVAGEQLVFIQMIDRNPEMVKGPPATAKALQEYVASHPREVHGAIIYDLFIANNDRAFGPERRNLMLDVEGRLLLYDQGNACFYRNRPGAQIEAGIPRLDAVEADLGAMFDMAHKANHYFEFLTDWRLVEEWCSRIQQLPDFLIEAAVARIPSYVARPTGDERERLQEFLIARKDRLLDNMIARQNLFTGLPQRGSHA
jgi:hypothetical protein